MMKKVNHKLSLDRPTTYQIKVPGHLDARWAEWVEKMIVSVDCEENGRPVTTLIGTMDQAGLQGLLRRLYALGLPLISVNILADSPSREQA
ncbi:MAG: hypothetical protein QNJ45_00045 [Ardenticatenaceae bacterium]|nr:hypothetical protein [Ardenticatenaceae bacterium]